MIHRAIKVFRQFNKMTQSEVAEQLSISKSYLSEIESGKKTLSVDLLERFAQLYDMPVSSLVFFSEELSSSASKSSEKFRMFATDKLLSVLEWAVERENSKKSFA